MHNIATVTWHETCDSGGWWPVVLSHHWAGKMNTGTSSTLKT